MGRKYSIYVCGFVKSGFFPNPDRVTSHVVWLALIFNYLWKKRMWGMNEGRWGDPFLC